MSPAGSDPRVDPAMTAEREAPAEMVEQPVRDVVAIGASAGGVEALVSLVRHLPEDFPAAVLVVLHVLATGQSMLPQILDRAGSLHAVSARDGEAIVPGRIYVAPPDHHLLIRDGKIGLSHGPLENGHRPAIDPLFRSAARACGARVVGVVLSGLLDDGALGLREIKECGGATVVQDPSDALFSPMPLAAIGATTIDRIVPVAQLATVLREMTGVAVAPVGDCPDGDCPDNEELDLLERDPTALALVDGPPSLLSCPACGGAMWETIEGSVLRFTCQVGHAYSQESMLDAQSAAVEHAMWSAVRALEERAELLLRVSYRQRGGSRARCERRAREAQDQARSIRAALVDRDAAARVADA